MKRFLTILTLFGLFISSSQKAVAKNIKCSVESVQGGTIVLYCGGQTERIKPGEEVTVKKVKKEYHGC